MRRVWRAKVTEQACEQDEEAERTGATVPSSPSALPIQSPHLQLQLDVLEREFLEFKQRAGTEGWSPRHINDELSTLIGEFARRIGNSASIAASEESAVAPQFHRLAYNACSEAAVLTFLHGGLPSGLLRCEIMGPKPEPGWASTLDSMRRTIKSMARIILHDAIVEADDEVDDARKLEELRIDMRRIWEDSALETHDKLFKTCTILSATQALGLKLLPMLRSPEFMLELANVKAFMYPYLVSNKFRHVMFVLCGLVFDALISNTAPAPEEEVSIDPSIEGWDSPKLLEIIEDAWLSWHLTAFTGDLLQFLHAEAVTAVSKDDSSVSTLVCGVNRPEVLRFEALASCDPGDESNVSLAWDKVSVLELMMHEFSRVWRRMLQPAIVDLTPRGIGPQESPNTGSMIDTIIWGFSSSQILHKALDISAWDDPNTHLFWRT